MFETGGDLLPTKAMNGQSGISGTGQWEMSGRAPSPNALAADALIRFATGFARVLTSKVPSLNSGTCAMPPKYAVNSANSGSCDAAPLWLPEPLRDGV